MRERIYDISSRNKLPRNKYGIIYSENSASGLFGASDKVTSALSGLNVGGDLTDFKDFVGATSTTDGERGIVPAPLAGQQDFFLKGTGAWTDIPAYRWFREFPDSDGLEKSGLQIDGDLKVNERLLAKYLEADQAHFWELVIDEVSANGGQVFVSPSLFYIDYLGTIIDYPITTENRFYTRLKSLRSDIWNLMNINNVQSVRARRIYMRCDNNERRILNEVAVGDMLRCRTFNIREGVYHNVQNKDYWTFVVETGEQTIEDEQGNRHPCIWCDIAYALKVDDHINIHFGSTLTKDGIISPTGEKIYDVSELKKRTRQTLDESTEYFEENPTKDEYNEIFEDVYTMIGVQSLIQKYILGIPPYGNYTDRDEWTDAGYISDEIVAGTGLNDSLTVDLIYDGSFSNDSNNNTSDSALNDTEDVIDKVLGYSINDPRVTIDIDDSIDSDGTTTITDSQTGDTVIVDNDHYDDYVDNTTTVDEIYEEYSESWLFCYGTLDTTVDDELVCFGNLWDEERMNVIVISSTNPIDYELKAPCIAQYNGIDRFGINLSDYRQTAIAKNGNEFYGKFLVDYNGRYIEVGEQVSMFINDLKTGLETVGIHLDGANSTIKFIGNVELRQNSDGVTDTLKVFDTDNNLRVEITPDEIPTLADIEGKLGRTEYKTTSAHDLSAPYYGVLQEEEFKTGILWWKEVYWKYTLPEGAIKRKRGLKINLGKLPDHIKVVLDNFKISSKNKLLFNGDKEMDRGLVTQKVTKAQARIYKDHDYSGTDVMYTFDWGRWDEDNPWNYSVNGLDSDTFLITSNPERYWYNTSHDGEFIVPWDENSWHTSAHYDNCFFTDYESMSIGTNYPMDEGWYIGIVWEEWYGGSIFSSTKYSNPYITIDSDYSVSLKLKFIYDDVESIKGKTTIGTDGVAMVNGTNKFLYVGDSGIIGRWNEFEISLTDEGGAKVSGKNQILSDDYNNPISPSTSFVDATAFTAPSPGTAGNVKVFRLPSASDYGVGRMMTIIGNDYTAVYAAEGDVIVYARPTDYSESATIPQSTQSLIEVTNFSMSDLMTKGSGNSTRYYRTHKTIITLVSSGSAWYITNLSGDLFNPYVSVLY